MKTKLTESRLKTTDIKLLHTTSRGEFPNNSEIHTLNFAKRS